MENWSIEIESNFKKATINRNLGRKIPYHTVSLLLWMVGQYFFYGKLLYKAKPYWGVPPPIRRGGSTFIYWPPVSGPGWRPDWFRDTFRKIHCENYTFFSATLKNEYWQKCWSLLPKFWRALLQYFHFICIFYFMWSRKLFHKKLSLKIFYQEVAAKIWRKEFGIF